MDPIEPIPAVYDGGRDMASGRFLPGNQLARGSAVARKAARFRTAMFRCVTPTDFREVVQKLLEEAKAGEPWATKLVLQYLVGPPQEVALEERLIVLETVLTGERE